MLSPNQFGGTGSRIKPGGSSMVPGANPFKPTFPGKSLQQQPGQLSGGYQKSYQQRNAQIKPMKNPFKQTGFGQSLR